MENKITTVIVDDELLARKGLSIRLEQFPQIEVVSQAGDGEQAIEDILTHKPMLVFLDIQMPGMSGFEVLAKLQSLLPKDEWPIVVFATAFDQYALQAFEVHALDYLLKPVNDDRLSECMDKIMQTINNQNQMHNQDKLVSLMSKLTGTDSHQILQQLAEGSDIEINEYSDFISVKDIGETTRIPVSDVIWIDAAGDYMCVHCADGETHILRKTMKQLEQELDPNRFIRVHRSVIVNNAEVAKVLTLSSGEYVIQLTNKHEIRVSRSYRDKVREKLL
jgi:two-component system LytT family response regulator